MRIGAKRQRQARRDEYMGKELPTWLNGLLIFGSMAAVLVAELRRPLRQSRQEKVRRNVRNAALSLMTAATIAGTEKPVTARLTRAAQARRRGLLKRRRLPVAAELFLAVVLLDYTLFVWHYLTHKVPFLWRFHQVHHVDLDLDASTALRFHAGEMLLSVPWRAAQVRVFGIAPRALALWQTLTLMAILFHHSNLRLPAGIERRLCRLLVTPRMHGIHHSAIREETDSNWATIFAWPDYLHRTLRLNVPQAAITVGVPAFQNPAELTIGRLLKMPFTADRPSWRAPDGGEPQRKDLPPSRWQLTS